jgi:hypothetical protein
VVDTPGGRMHVRWDQGAAATPHGQLVYFAEFLAATGVFERWVSSCPLEYQSGNAPNKRDVLGTLMLGLLAGHRRYAHITALRGDAVAAQAERCRASAAQPGAQAQDLGVDAVLARGPIPVARVHLS